MFEVQDLKYATLATVSRCGMVWFSEDVVSTEMCFENYFQRLRNVSLDEMEAVQARPRAGGQSSSAQQTMTPTADAIKDDLISPNLQVRSEKNFFFERKAAFPSYCVGIPRPPIIFTTEINKCKFH